MTLKQNVSALSKKGLKFAGKTFLKDASKLSTWALVYIAFVVSNFYSGFKAEVQRAAEINADAANRIKAMCELTPEELEKYGLTPEQGLEVAEKMENFSKTEEQIISHAGKMRKSWRDWLPGAHALEETSVKRGTSLEEKQAALAIASFAQAEDAYNKEHSAAKTPAPKTPAKGTTHGM